MVAFNYIILGPGLHNLGGQLFAAFARDHDHQDLGIVFKDGSQNFKAVYIGQYVVQGDQVGRIGFHQVQGLPPGSGDAALMPGLGKMPGLHFGY